MGTNDDLHTEPTGYVPEKKMGPGYRNTLDPSEPVGQLPGAMHVIAEEDTHGRIQSFVGIGGAPTRPSTLPDDAALRKQYPVASGVLDYFPDAIVALSHLSWVGNHQHNPGQPLHWDRSKSTDEADTCIRHFMARGTKDTDGVRHSVKALWRMAAIVQKEIEAERENDAQSTAA